MQKYKFLPHTADIKFQAFGNTLEKAFENSALALTNIITKDKIKSKTKKTIKIKGKDKEALLYSFLEEFLYLLETKNFLLSKINNLEIEKQGKNYKLKAEILGDNSKNYELETHIKAITYNDMKVGKQNNKYVCQVVVDV